MNTTKDELDPRVEAALVAFCRLAGGNVGHWPSGASEHDRVTIRAAMAESLAAADAVRPPMTREDEVRTDAALTMLLECLEWGTRDIPWVVRNLREHFDITPKVKS